MKTKQTEKHYCEGWVWNKYAERDCPCDNSANRFRNGGWYCWRHDPLGKPIKSNPNPERKGRILCPVSITV